MIALAPRLATVACFLVLVAGGDRACAADGGTPVACTTPQAGFGAAQLRCEIAPSVQAQVLRFRAAFQGVHDDSTAGFGASLDGRPVTCSVGSRPRIEGDGDGDTLSCTFAVPAAAAARELRIQLVWHHAEPVAYALRRD